MITFCPGSLVVVLEWGNILQVEWSKRLSVDREKHVKKRVDRKHALCLHHVVWIVVRVALGYGRAKE